MELERVLMGYPLIDLTGQQFNAWTVLRADGRTHDGRVKWLCQCSCGAEQHVDGYTLRKNISTKCKSCASRGKTFMRGKPGQRGLTSLWRTYKKGARDRSLSFTIEKDFFAHLTKQPCTYCGVLPHLVYSATHKYVTPEGKANGAYTYNGVDRVDNTRGYDVDNVATCCWDCNMAKGKKTAEEHREWIRRSYEHMFNTKIPQA